MDQVNRIRLRIGDVAHVKLGWSGVCAHMGVAEKIVWVELLPNDMAQLYVNGCPFSFPVTYGEASIYREGGKFYAYVVGGMHEQLELTEFKRRAKACTRVVVRSTALPHLDGKWVLHKSTNTHFSLRLEGYESLERRVWPTALLCRIEGNTITVLSEDGCDLATYIFPEMNYPTTSVDGETLRPGDRIRYFEDIATIRMISAVEEVPSEPEPGKVIRWVSVHASAWEGPWRVTGGVFGLVAKA